MEASKAEAIEASKAEACLEVDEGAFAVSLPEPGVSSSFVASDEKGEGRGRRKRRLTAKMLESPVIKKETKRKSGGDDVEIGGRMKDKQGVALVEPEPEKGKTNKSRKSIIAKESLGINKDKTAKASGKRGLAQEEKTPDPVNKVTPVVEEEESLASRRRRKRKGDSEPLVEAVKKGRRGGGSEVEESDANQSRRNNVAQVLEVESDNRQSRRSNVAEVLASTSSNIRVNNRQSKKEEEQVEK